MLDAQLVTDALHKHTLDTQQRSSRGTHKNVDRSVPPFPIYMDPMHVSCDVYRELNLLLLSRLCPVDHTRHGRRKEVASARTGRAYR